MNQTEIDVRIKALKKKYPKMFSASGIGPGEICLGPTPFSLQAASLRIAGLKSARAAETDVMMEVEVSVGNNSTTVDKVSSWMLFANQREFIEWRYGRKQKGKGEHIGN